MCISNLFAQDRYVNPFDGSDVPLVEEPNSFVPEDNVPTFNRDPCIYTDEYGSQSVNRAVDFGLGGFTKRVQIPNHPDFNQNYIGTIEMWVYPTDLSNDIIFFSKGNTLSTSNYFLGWSTIPSRRLMFGFGGPNSGYFYSGVSLSENTWTHIAVTWMYVGGGQYTCRFYRNGDLVATKTENCVWYFNNDPILIGGSNFSPGHYMKGYIDEVRFWGRRRTTAQIRDNRFVGLGDFGAANTGNALTSSLHYSGLISSWTFNFNSGTAYDDIGQHHGTYMSGCGVSTRLAGQPIPYNLALKCDGSGANSYVKIPDNSIFDQTSSGSFEAWIYLNATGFQPIFQKGATQVTTTFAVGISSFQFLFLTIGGVSFMSYGTTLTTGKWYHVAATWSGGPNFTIKLYVNGVLAATHTHNVTMPTNSDDAWIGRDYGSHRFNGYIDEVRIWDLALTQEQIKNNMIISGRALLQDSQLEGVWNFDGHLGNLSSTSGIDGSFNTGTGNDCRLSGYSNENISGAYNDVFNAHTTVLNGTYVNQAYFRGKSGLPIPVQGYVQDTIKVTKWPSNVTTVHALISIQHQFCEDIDIRITAPNGQTRDISTDNGGISDNGYLTIFYDGHSQPPVTSSLFLSPWSNYVKPEVVMGNFGGSPINGNWILTVTDDTPGDSGTLMGWGLRFNNSVINISPISSNVPGEYRLHQNYPNPFNPVTNINFDIPKAGLVSIKIYDITGREISMLVDQSLKAGSYNVEFDASNFASGTYFYKIQASDFTDVKKMMLVK